MNHALVDAARMTTHLERCIQDLESTEPTQVTAMLSNLKYAQGLLSEQSSTDKRTRNLVTELHRRLELIQTRLDSKSACLTKEPLLKRRPPNPKLQPVPTAVLVQPEPKAHEDTPPPHRYESAPLNLDPSPKGKSRLEDSELLPRTALRRRKQQEAANPSPSDHAKVGSADSERILQHHRSIQDALTADLQRMASQLKQNSLYFSENLQKDKGLLTTVEDSMGSGLTGMQKERTRLGAYKKKGGWTTCYVVMAVAGVAVAWFFMFALIRIT